jgi:DNA (cytosine-5)-methyltransferase 1
MKLCRRLEVPTVGSLFSGIGGFDLGLERAGFTVKWQVENNAFCQEVLKKHWPHVQRFSDVQTVDWGNVPQVDLLCGGFPCQPVSLAGKRQAQSDDRWLWPEFLRCIGVLRPGYVLIENVPGLLTAGFGDILSGLASFGFDAEWDCIPASAVGAHHLRDRVWIIAHRPEKRTDEGMESVQAGELSRQFRGMAWRARTFRMDQPTVVGTTDGIPNYVDRCEALGNAIVPQIAEALGRMILTSMEASHAENVLGRANVSTSQSVRRKDSR